MRRRPRYCVRRQAVTITGSQTRTAHGTPTKTRAPNDFIIREYSTGFVMYAPIRPYACATISYTYTRTTPYTYPPEYIYIMFTILRRVYNNNIGIAIMLCTPYRLPVLALRRRWATTTTTTTTPTMIPPRVLWPDSTVARPLLPTPPPHHLMINTTAAVATAAAACERAGPFDPVGPPPTANVAIWPPQSRRHTYAPTRIHVYSCRQASARAHHMEHK